MNNTEKLYVLVDLAKRIVPQQETLIAEDSQASSQSAVKLAEGMRAHKVGQKPVQEDAKPPVKPYLYS